MRIFDLPAPACYALDSKPLVLAVVQLNYPVVGRLQTLEGITPLQEALKGSFPFMHLVQVDQVEVVIAPGAPTVSPAQRSTGWRFSDDSGWILNINPAAAQLAIGKEYESVETMESRLRLVVDGLASAAEVRRCERLGVRFINFAEVATGEELEWRSWFRPEIVGWTGMDFFSEGTQLQSTLQQSVLQSPNGQAPRTQALIRNGLLPAGTALPKPDGTQHVVQNNAFVLDIDIFVEAAQPMEAESLLSQFREIHADIDSFFRKCLTPEGEKRFGLRQL
jgi:uncharacterized protein (TIGR04255 family)